MSNKKKIALIGNPNSGKTSLFNALTGLNQTVGNYPGVTVDKKTGKYTFNNTVFEVIDLPGIYSIKPKSEDEKVALNYLEQNEVETVIYVADAANLKRSLLLCTQIMDKGHKVVVALNMLDVAQDNGILIDEVKLSEKLNIPFVRTNSRLKSGIRHLKKVLDTEQQPVEFLGFSNPVYTSSILKRYEKIAEILAISTTKTAKKGTITQFIDKYAMHPVFGYIIFLLILQIMFQSIFNWSSYPSDWIEMGFNYFSSFLKDTLPPSTLTDLLTDGILSGLAGIAVFVPQIAFLFFFIAILEDTGYMTRVSFILDKLMRKIGLNGRSVIPLMGGIACAVPAIMSARTISNKKERLITILTTPFMTCSARIPVYILIISIIIPNKMVGGIFNLQGLALTSLYFIGIFVTIIASLIISKFVKNKDRSSFIMDMPVYRMPRWSNIGYTILEKVKLFLFNAGKIIVAISIVLWAMSSYGPSNRFQEIEKKYELNQITPTQYNSLKLENSYAGILGKTIEPVIAPLGFNWKIGIALITSFAAREVFVGTMATIYSVADEENTSTIREKMLKERNSDGSLAYNFAVGFSLLLFYAFAMQCVSTLAIVYNETKSMFWPAIQFVYMTGFAYLCSFIAYQMLS